MNKYSNLPDIIDFCPNPILEKGKTGNRYVKKFIPYHYADPNPPKQSNAKCSFKDIKLGDYITVYEFNGELVPCVTTITTSDSYWDKKNNCWSVNVRYEDGNI